MTTISSQPPISPQPAPAPSAAPSATLDLQDLQNLLVILDLACQRGAFRAPELTQIGMVFDKVNTFMKAAVPQDTAAAEQGNIPPIPTASSIPPAASPVMPASPISPPPFSPKVGA